MILFEKLTKHLAAQPGKMFLIDGVGALVSAFFLGFVLTSFQAHIGMPIYILTFLSLIALLFAVYSLISCLWVKQNHRFFLRIITYANFIYCLITGGMIIIFQNQLTLIGFCYFLVEIFLILSLVFLEFRLLKQKTPL